MTVLATAGITYASAVGSAPASPAVHRAAQPHPAHRAAQPAHRAARPARPAAQPPQQAAAAAASSGGRGEGRDGGGRGRGRGEGGRIYFNERTYSAEAEGCITAGGSGSSFSVFNDSRKTVEVFRGFSCDNGSPVAVVGPHGETSGVAPRAVHEGLFGFGDDGVVGSFRVVCDHDEW
ncbi:hypothetical protein ABT187_08660 [Streptomyces sp. NPDC001817]|uniref:hypothetical protein n=1 Tax=Streptomyces sp. NPDC001817 TaxID=3154398 RepID=UPI003323B7B9